MLADWQTFFATAGGAAATLAGLLFVGTSLQLRRIASLPELLALSTETTVEFGLVLLGSLILQMATDGWAVGAPLAILGMLAMVAALVEWRRSSMAGASATTRLLLPALCSVLVAGGAIGIGVGSSWAPYALAMTMATLLGLGLRNAWELLLQMDEPAAQAPGTPPEARSHQTITTRTVDAPQGPNTGSTAGRTGRARGRTFAR